MPLVAASIMTTNVIWVAPGDSVPRVARMLSNKHISAVPVCDADGGLLGILSEGDLMRPFSAEAETRRAWWLRMLAEGIQLAPEFLDYVRVDRRVARDLMVSPVITVTEDTAVPAIADLMMRHRIKRVPVLRDGKVVGIVARADIVAAMVSTPERMLETL